MIKILLNGKSHLVPKNTSILSAIRNTGGRVPTLCYNGRYKPLATCRLCMVKTSKSSKWVPACNTMVEDNLQVTYDDDELDNYRKQELKLLLARHPNECMNCTASNGNCKLQDSVHDLDVSEGWPKSIRGANQKHIHPVRDFSSPSISRDMRKCIECGLCVQACGTEQGQDINAIGFTERGGNMLPVTVFDQPLSQTPCIDCGQCTNVCPVGALTEHPDWQRVLHELDAKRKTLIVQTAPATRVAISEEFGLPSGSISTGKLVNALRQVGFDYVFDTNFAADVTIMEEGSEFLQRLSKNEHLPLMTSCCPGWINYVEKSHPELIPHLSTAKSPQQMHGALTRKFYGKDAFVVSIMPCTAKKGEAIRPGMKGDVDAVLTTRELAILLKARRIPFASLPDDGKYDNPLGESTGAAIIFGATGGVLEAALRTALVLAGAPPADLNFHAVRGMDRVKECEIPGVGTVVAINGISAVQKLFKTDPEWYKKYKMIEVMACKGGCLGGGGEPKSDDPEILKKRMKGIYAIDEQFKIRQSHLNPHVIKLYKEHLEKPLSEEAEELLHTTYYPRGSKREILARFLDAVDRHDTETLTRMFERDATWDTNSPFGIVTKNEIPQLVERLPKLDKRHKLAESGLEATDKFGNKVAFDITLGPTNRIQSIVRISKQ